ncbi:MAG: sulfatase-like hydrolase/transferase [Bdellovibrionales bacterium]|nr:sulfatase-like hydrolase/transferase [Bdellovibrionales bacterium]
MSCWLALLSLFFLSACQWNVDKRPSVIVIAIESLNFRQVNCEQGQELNQGFQIFCDEAIRFTHNFTPSTMSQAALASVLTALFPIEHGVWHNGNQYLSKKFETVAEVALDKGYRTAFFSGGPPIFSKSGFGQGFEKFDDHINLTLESHYTPASKSFSKFFKWLNNDVGDHPHFSVIYIPDLQFIDVPTVNNVGQQRARGYKGQLLELDESLNELINKLKQKKLWHNSHVFLFGLNSYSEQSRPEEPSMVNLYSEIVQTPLFIKPAQKLRDKGIHWKIDKNVSLVDIGATLYELFGYIPDSPEGRELEVTSLAPILDKPDVAWDSNRYILIETAYPQWRELGGSRFSVRSGHYSMVYDKQIKLYNTLIDRNEISPISHKDKLWTTIFSPIHSYMKSNGLNQWEGINKHFVEKIKIAKEIWSIKNKNVNTLIKEINVALWKNRTDKELYGWKAELALNNNLWKNLMNIAKKAKNKYWLYLAKRKLGQPINIPPRGCFQFFTKTINDISKLKECNDKLFNSLMRWKMQGKGKKRDRLFDAFIRNYYNFKLEKKLKIENLKNGLIWDVEIEQDYGPGITEVYLNLTKNKKLNERIKKRLLKLQ